MDINDKHALALIRYSLIAPLVTGTKDPNESYSQFYKRASEIECTLPDGKKRKFSASTIEHWYSSYRKYGFDGLVTTDRKDEGVSRSITPELEAEIKYLKETYPKMPATSIMQKLLDDGAIHKGQVSLSSITRCVNRIMDKNEMTFNKDMRRYERPHINDVWYGDTCCCFSIRLQTGAKQRIYIIGLIDDASRFIVGAHAFGNDDFVNLMSVIRSAVAKYGIPKVFSFDNGRSYRNKQMELLMARIGSTLNFCQPYSPVQKAKCERFWGTLKSQWMSTLNPKDFDSIETLDKSLQNYINKYNNSVHSSLGGKSPQDRFFSEPECIKRISQEKIDKSFLLEIERRVSPDCVIVINGIEYEVDCRYAKQRVRLRYSPDMTEIYIVESDESLKPIHLLNKIQNSMVKREKVRYSEASL